MSRNFLSFPFAPYQGTPSSKAFNNGRGQLKGLMVGYSIIWATYKVGIQSLGSKVPNFTVNTNLNAAGPNSVSQGWTIESVYIDNEGVNFPVYVFFPSTGFAVSCPPNSSGWFQVFTIDRLALITAIGIPDIDIANLVQTNVFFTDAFMVPYLDQEQQTAVQFGLSSPLISLGTSGGGISSINITQQGSNYAGGALSITGGGGAGALAHGTIDGFGRFTSVVIDNPGSGYSGFPVITPTSGQVAYFPAWAPFVGYAPSNTVTFGNQTYQAQASVPASNVSPPEAPSLWLNLSVQTNVALGVSSTITPIVGGASIAASSNYGAYALGDQSTNIIVKFTSLGVFKTNLWATPFSSGFIYLTNIYVNDIGGAAGVNQFQIEDAAGDVLYFFESAGVAGTLFELQRCNVKIPAKNAWQIRCTGFAVAADISFGFAWTYSQN